MTDLRKKLPCTINVLGTPYRVEMRKREDDTDLKAGSGAYCHGNHHLIVIGDLSTYEGNVRNENKRMDMIAVRETECLNFRHELVHAFLNESGLQDDAFEVHKAWPNNEEMVGWFAIQSPKIFKVYKELGIL